MSAMIGGRPHGTPIDHAARRQIAYHYLDRLLILRLWRPGGWQPRVRLSGEEHLDRAIADGTGAILWVADFSFASLLAKLALHGAGYEVNHLSRRQHGFSVTRFGVRFLNPIRTRVEDRYLRERIPVSTAGRRAAMQRMQQLLGEGGLVSITASDWASRAVEAPFLGGHVRLAPGPAVLSAKTGAPVLPVIAVRVDDGSFAVQIGPPLTVDTGASRDEAVAALVRRYARALEPHVLDRPGQWRGWEATSPGTDPPP